MLRSVVKNLPTIDDAIDVMGHNDRERKITPIKSGMVDELILVLQPLEKATKTVEGDHMVTISAVCPIIIGLKVRV